jgi:hypothetical protein
MKRRLMWIVATAILVIAFLLYHFRSANDLNIDPHAREVIEKAKQR